MAASEDKTKEAPEGEIDELAKIVSSSSKTVSLEAFENVKPQKTLEIHSIQSPKVPFWVQISIELLFGAVFGAITTILGTLSIFCLAFPILTSPGIAFGFWFADRVTGVKAKYRKSMVGMAVLLGTVIGLPTGFWARSLAGPCHGGDDYYFHGYNNAILMSYLISFIGYRLIPVVTFFNKLKH